MSAGVRLREARVGRPGAGMMSRMRVLVEKGTARVFGKEAKVSMRIERVVDLAIFAFCINK